MSRATIKPYSPERIVSAHPVPRVGFVFQHTQHFGENENQNHSDEQSRLLRGTTDTSITDNANGETSSQTSETDRQTGTELDEAGEEGSFLAEIVGDQHTDDQAVDGNDTSHDDGDDVCGDRC